MDTDRAGGRGALGLYSKQFPPSPATSANQPLFEDLGEALWHGIDTPSEVSVTYAQPLFSLSFAARHHHAPIWLRRHWEALLHIGLVAILALGALAMGSWSAAALAGFLWKLTASGAAAADPVQMEYAILVMLAFLALYHCLRDPSRLAGLTAGAAVGASLLYRSPLALVPILAMAGAWVLGRLNTRSQICWAGALTIPALMLLPWMHLNLTINATPYPFEFGKADTNLISGALGIRSTIEGDARQLLPKGSLADSAPLGKLGWALSEMLRHPLRTLGAIFGRFALLFRWQPFLIVLACLAIWRRRKSQEAAALSGFIGYFAGVHCLLSIQKNYFIPLWPLMALLAAWGAAHWVDPLSGQPRENARRNAQRATTLLAACAFALCVAALTRVNRYASLFASGQLTDPSRLDRAISQNPADAWLLYRRASRDAASADVSRARTDFEKILPEARRRPPWRLTQLWTEAIAGQAGPLMASDFPAEAAESGKFRAVLRLLRAEIHMRKGNQREADKELRAASAIWRQDHVRARDINTPNAQAAVSKLRRQAALQLLELTAPYRFKGSALFVAKRLGQAAAGEETPPHNGYRLILALRSASHDELALKLIDEHLGKNPSSPPYLYARALSLKALGRLPEAEQAALKAVGKDRGMLRAALLAAQIALEQGNRPRAFEISQAALSAPVSGAEIKFRYPLNRILEATRPAL